MQKDDDQRLDTPWGLETFLKGEAVTKVTKPSQFIRLCGKIVQERQYRTIIYAVGDWPRNPVYIDMQTANVVITCWNACRFRNKRKLVQLVRQGGPLHLAELCWKAVSRKKAT